MQSTAPRPRHSRIGALLWLFFSVSLAWGSDSSALRDLSGGFARSGAADDVLLEVTVSGGYSASSRISIRLQGDGRLQETTTFAHTEATRAPEARERVLAEKETDRLLDDLAAAGLAGITNDEFLQQLQRAYPRTVLLLGGSDCATMTIRIHLFKRAADGMTWEKSDTDLRLECAFGYARAFPGVSSAQSVSALLNRLKSLVRMEGDE